MYLIEAEHIYRSFGSSIAVHDVSLHVEAGEIFGLVGPDGAGKTTTMRLLCGAYLPTIFPENPVPRIRIVGCDLLEQPEQARAKIGYLPQRFSLYDELTVMENLRFFAEVRGLPRSEWLPRCMELLTFVGLASYKDRRAGQLSGGMKQKLGLAAVLVHQPIVLMLDEPTTGVDPVTRQDFWQLLIQLISSNEALSQTHPAVLISTPYMDEAARCTRLGLMIKGSLALVGTPEEIRSSLKGQIFELVGEPMVLLRKIIERADFIDDFQMFGDRLHLRIQPQNTFKLETRLRKIITSQGGSVIRFQPIEAGLEDVFIGLLDQGKDALHQPFDSNR